ncbi:hypothetical protein ABER23_21790 [Paenibacillus lautus]|uniref:hypothetical protein n=1 Tax=Paenibacillus lautus TaxID=1401 RepID=UPI003D291316
MKRILTSLFTAIFFFTLSIPVFASENNVSQSEYDQFKNDFLEATLEGNHNLAESFVDNASPELLAHYANTADVFDSEKVNEKLKDLKLGPNGSTVVIMDDGSFVEVTTTTRQVNDNNVPIENNEFSTMDYKEDYDMSGTSWVTDYTYDYGGNGKLAVLKLNTYYTLGRNMKIYETDTSGTKGSAGIGVSSSASVTANNVPKARARGTYNINIFGGGSETYTLYTEVGFLNAWQDPYGYFYVSYYTDSWRS